MACYLLDTTVLIDVLNERGESEEALARLIERGNTLACCAVNVAEIYAGLRPKEEQRTKDLLESLNYLDLTPDCARMAGTFKREAARQGRTLSLADCMVAAAAACHGSILVTDNRKDFPMQGLAVQSPAEL